MEWVVKVTPWPFYPSRKTRSRCRGGWVGPSAILEWSRKFRPHRIRSPNRPARSESLHGLSYTGPFIVTNNTQKTLMLHWKMVKSYGLNLIWQNFTGKHLRVMRFLLILRYVKEMQKWEIRVKMQFFFFLYKIYTYIRVYMYKMFVLLCYFLNIWRRRVNA
jgi:hypothetical protein